LKELEASWSNGELASKRVMVEAKPSQWMMMLLRLPSGGNHHHQQDLPLWRNELLCVIVLQLSQ
jgi:hypothetical protein